MAAKLSPGALKFLRNNPQKFGGARNSLQLEKFRAHQMSQHIGQRQPTQGQGAGSQKAASVDAITVTSRATKKSEHRNAPAICARRPVDFGRDANGARRKNWWETTTPFSGRF